MRRQRYKLNYFCDNSFYVHILTAYVIFINYDVVVGSRGALSASHSSNGVATSGDGNTLTNNIIRRNGSHLNELNAGSSNSNNLLIGLSSCQTVCACKWKGGKQTVECIDHALISIPENIDPSTQVLDMSGNNLQILPHEQFIRANLLNLQKLYLRNCRIGQIDSDAFKGLTNLVDLDLSHNLLTAVPSTTLSYIPSLRDLTLASNPIQKIDGYTFRNTPNLHKLDLSHCDIQTIAPQAFEGLESLLSLKLNGNKLAELRPRTIETLSRLHGVELHDNPWMCDCRLRAAKIWLTEKNIPYPVPPICSGGPERVIDRTFLDLQVDDFACRPEMLPVNRYVESTMGDNATINCRASAIPAATITWYWNGRLLNNGSAFSSYQRVYIYEDGDREKRSRLVLTNSQETDSSEFYCVAENKAGTAEANFTLHVAVRTAGMASLGSGQIVGLSAALVILILFILLIALFLLIRIKRTPFIESKTPNHLEVVTTVNQPNSVNCKQQSSSMSPQGMITGNGVLPNRMETDNIERKNSFTGSESKQTNPVQKPPRLTDLPYANSAYEGGSSALSSASCFISPTASAGNNPDLINDTKRCDSDEFVDLKIPAVLTAKDCLDHSSLVGASSMDRPGSGEYSRAGGCDSLYPSGLWENSSAQANNYNSDDLYLKRATSTTLSGFNCYSDKTPIIDNTHLYDLRCGTTNEYFSKTFPRTHFGNMSTTSTASTTGLSGGGAREAASTTLTTTTTLSSSGGVSGYPSDYGLPLVPGAEQQVHHPHYAHPPQPSAFNNNSSCSNNNNNKNSNPLPAALPNGMPINAKTIRVWQKGGVPVLPPVTALKRALTSSSRNSPDEGYQEGCGTDV